MSKLSAFLHPVAPEAKEIIISERFVGEDGKPVPFKIRPLTQEENDALVKRAKRTRTVNGMAQEYATTDCTENPNHVGFVGARTGTVLTIYEGNKGAAVATRPMQINGRYIRGYCLPDYASKADKEDEIVTYDQWKAFMTQYRQELQDNDSGEWSKEAREWAVSTGIVTGGGEINGLPNYMWEDLSTREQLITVLYRFAKSIGQA